MTEQLVRTIKRRVPAMMSYTMPLPVRKLLDGYKDVMLQQGSSDWLSCAALLCGFTFNQSSLSAIVRSLAWSPSVSTLQRVSSNFDGPRFMKRLRSKVLKYILKMLKSENTEDFCIAVDDTPIEKFSENLPGFGRWATSSQDGYSGHKVLVVTLINKKENFAIPLFYKVLKKKDEDSYENYTTIILT